jgi:hypothetical protein
MKYCYLVICAFIFSACTDATPKAKPGDQVAARDVDTSFTARQSSGTGKWSDSFRKFSEAVASGDKERVKLFIDFPIRNEGNEIWLLANPKLVEEMATDDIKPFTESDFDRYFSSIFSMDIRKTLQGLDLEQFSKTGQSSSAEMEVVKDSKTALEANYDSTAQKITLILTTAVEDLSEFSVLYQFDVIKNGEIKFRQVRIAG